MTLDCEVVVTHSGARAVRDKLTGELMHPVGPLVESRLMYVEPSRLEARLCESRSTEAPNGPLVLWDVGLGAGSNAIAAWRCSEMLQTKGLVRRPLCMVSFDRSLAALELALAPAHAPDFGLEGTAAEAARGLLRCGAHQTPHAIWQLRLGELGTTLPAAMPPADIVFWDPFSPRANAEAWTVSVFEHVRRACRPGATLHTYSGATQVRSALVLAGFAVGIGEKVAEGKFGTCAATTPGDLREPLDRRWLERLRRSTAPLPPGAPANALERIAAAAQFAG